MKKLFLSLVVCLMALTMSAQSYTIISRSNDTIRLFPNKLGDAVKSIIPGKTDEESHYRLIEKDVDGKKSLIFVEFTQVLDKIFVTYETDLVNNGKWIIATFSYIDIFNSVKRDIAVAALWAFYAELLNIFLDILTLGITRTGDKLAVLADFNDHISAAFLADDIGLVLFKLDFNAVHIGFSFC